MALNLSTLTNPATSDSVLLEAQSEADFLEPIVLFKNRATGSNAIANDATQTTANDQPLSLPLIDGGGYLYQPDVTGNAPAVNIPSISANEDFVFEMEVYLVNATSFHLASGDSVNKRFAVHSNVFYFSPESGACAPLSTGASTLTVERSGATATLKQDGVVKATLAANIADNAYDFTHLSFNGQYLTSIGKLNGYIKTATLSIEGTEVFNCDFADTSIEDGASSFDCSTGQTVTISTGSGVDQARIVRRPKALFNDSEMDLVWDGPTGDYFFVTATEDGVVSGEVSLVNSASAFRFASLGLPRTGNKRSGHQTLVGMWPKTISDSQKQALVDYAKTKSAGKNWAGIENFISFFRSSNLNSLDASYWDTGSATNFSYFAFSANKLESLDASSWDTSSCTNVSVFAASCPELTSLNVNGWDTSNVTNFSYFVQVCPKLTSLDLTSWDTSSATSFAVFAQNSSELTNVTVGANCFSQGTCTNFAAAFTNTNLNQQSIDDILVALESAGTSNGTFDRTGGEYPSVTGVAAKNALQARGWSMTFSSEVLPSVLDLEPAAAYSLRALKSSEDPNVVRVRRSSDGALSNFTASEVSDGTLTDWVNADVDLVTPTLNNGGFEDGSTGWTLSNGAIDTSEFYAGSKSVKLTVTGGAGAFVYKANLQVGSSYRVGFWAKISDASKQMRVEFGSAANKEDINFTSTNWEYKEVTKSATAVGLAFARQSTSADYTINIDNITITQLTADGHVTTWYDQAGSNDASQTLVSNMPKIVDGGTLVTEGGLPALDFDGTDDYFQLTSNVFPGQLEVGIVNHIEEDASKYQRLINLSNGTDDDFMVIKTNADQLSLRTSTTEAGNTSKQFGNVINNHNLIYATSTLSTDSYSASVDGASLSQTTGVALGSGSFLISTIGARSDFSSTSFSEGTFQEIVIYDTDQSANRTAIETNIMDHFSIS